MSSVTKAAVFHALIVVITCVLLFISYGPLARRMAATLGSSDNGLTSFGAGDLIEYWSAYRIAARGENPYDAAAMLAEQRLVDPQREVPLMMWNPPWLLVIMAPMLRSGFGVAVRAWLLAGLAVTLLSVLSYARMKRPGDVSTASFTLVLAGFPPVWQSLELGQSSILLLPAALIFFLLAQRERFFPAGIVLGICTIKPHLFHLVWLYIFWWSLRTRRISLMAGLLVSTAALALTARLIFPEATSAWAALSFSSFAAPKEVAPARWVTATLSGALAALSSGAAASLASKAIPWIAALGLLVVLLRRRTPPVFSAPLPGLLCLSVLTAPFGWFFDQVNLAPVWIRAARTPAVLALILIVHACVTLLWTRLISWHHQLFWYPLIPLAFFLAAGSAKKREQPK